MYHCYRLTPEDSLPLVTVNFSRLYNLIDKFSERTSLLVAILMSVLSRIDLLIALVIRDCFNLKQRQSKLKPNVKSVYSITWGYSHVFEYQM